MSSALTYVLLGSVGSVLIILFKSPNNIINQAYDFIKKIFTQKETSDNP